MSLNERAPVIAGLAYFLVVSGIALSEIHTRIFDPGHSDLAGLATYLFTLPSSFLVDRFFTAAGFPIGGSDGAFVGYCLASLLLNTGLVVLVASLLRRSLKRS